MSLRMTGHLNYGRENIVETYYTAHVWRGIYVAPGLQHIENPEDCKRIWKSAILRKGGSN
jgi:carbohydrate-selective porin OprB